jgi:lipopolysaccharide export system permease protein
MKILTKYIVKQFLLHLTLAIVAFVLLFLVVDIFENIGTLIENPVSFDIIVVYFLTKIPYVLSLTLPMAVMMATLISIGLMGRNLELIAMMSSGISHVFIIRPALIIAAGLSIISYFGNEYVVPQSNSYNEYITNVKIKKKNVGPGAEFRLDKIWVRNGNTIYFIDRFMPQDNTIEGITIYTFDDRFQLKERIIAAKAVWKSGRWVFYNVIENDFTGTGSFATTKYPIRYFSIKETPNDFKIVFEKGTEKMSYRELSNYIGSLDKNGYDTTRYRVDLQGKLSYPLACLILALVATPFALMVGRRGGLAMGVVIAFVISYLYWVIYSLCVALGHGGTIPPLVAAWTANVLFAIAGGYLLIAIRS